jgi:biopolymer transport protein ExbB
VEAVVMLVRLVRSAFSPWALPLCFVVACLFAAAPASAQDPDAAPAAAAPAAAAPATETPAAAPAAAPAGSRPLSEKEQKRLDRQNESVLAYYYRSLGLKYVLAFLALSFALVALIILNALALRKSAIMPDALVQNFEAALNEKNYQGAYEMAKSDDSFLGAVLAGGMSKLQSGYDAAEEAMNEAGADESMKLEHRLSYIALIGSLAPMVGLLGTVDGMIASFQTIETSGTTPDPAELAGGVSQALITTIVGLWLAIPAIAVFGIYKNKLARLLYDCGAVSESLMGRFQAVKK